LVVTCRAWRRPFATTSQGGATNQGDYNRSNGAEQHHRRPVQSLPDLAAPGTYTETVTMEAYVDIEGSGEVTIIRT
jgi:hypothetical protein